MNREKNESFSFDLNYGKQLTVLQYTHFLRCIFMCQAPSYRCVHLVLDCRKQDVFWYNRDDLCNIKTKKNIRCFSLIYCLFLLMLLHIFIPSPRLSQQVEVNGPSFEHSVAKFWTLYLYSLGSLIQLSQQCSHKEFQFWTLTQWMSFTATTYVYIHRFLSSQFHLDFRGKNNVKSSTGPFWAILYFFCTCQHTSDHLLVWVAFQFVEFNTVQLLKSLFAELAGVVVVGFWSVFLHMPVKGGTLATLIATDLTPDR